jgi:predicted dithiol-disulfide oxidoreductase (DUF899 family)
MTLTFPGESSQYRTARARLLEQEIELRHQLEAVARARRALPPGGLIPQDYIFHAATADALIVPVTLSELFAPGTSSLAIYSMMFPRDPSDRRPGAASGATADLPLTEAPCPSCAALLDQWDGAVEHLSVHMNLVVVAKAPAPRVAAFAQERGWRRLRLLSSAHNDYNRDYHGEDSQGHPVPMLNVFSREGDSIRHFWGSELFYAASEQGQDPRHLGTFEPVWNFFDVTREGRGEDWDEQLQYPDSQPCQHC